MPACSHSRFSLSPVMVGLSAFVFSLSAWSATTTSGSSVTELPEVKVTGQKEQQADTYQATHASVATKTNEPLVQVPQSVNVVTHQVIEDEQPDSLVEAIEHVSGIKESNTLGGTQDAILKRGFGTNRDNSIMRNGLQSVQARNFTPTTERVEVLKGPSSMLYGIQDPGGVINVVTKKPQLKEKYTVSGFGSSFGGGGGQLDMTGPIGDNGLAYRLIMDEQKTDYWRNFGDTHQGVIAPSLAWYGDTTTVLLDYEHMDYVIPFDRGTAIDVATGKPVDVPRKERLDEPYNKTAGQSDTANLKIDHQLSSLWDLHFGYGFSRNYYNDNQMRVMAINSTTGVLTRRADSTHDAQQQAHTVNLFANGHLPWGSTMHEVLVGTDYMHNYRTLGNLYRDSNTKNFNMYDPVYGTAAYPSTVSAKDSDQTDKLRTIAFYAQDAWHLDDHWILVGGLRYDHFDELTGKGRPFNANSQVSDGKAVPRAGVVYMINPDWSVYSNYAESFRPNTSIATAIGDLPPEEGKSWEVGTKWQDDRITASAALFNILKKNVQTTETIDGEDYTRVSGKVRSRGLESDFSAKLNDKWSTFGSYTYTDAKVTADPLLAGTTVDGVSRNMVSLGVARDFGTLMNGHVRVGGSARYASRWYIGNTQGTMYALPASTVVDMFANYDTKVAKQVVHLQFNVKNLFDETYYTSGVSSSTVPFVEYGAPREFLLKASVDL